MSIPLLPPEVNVYQKPGCKKDKKLESLIRKALHEFSMIQESDDTIGIALSGGKDSLTMASHLAYISGKGFKNFKLHAFMVTGPFSCGPALLQENVAHVCKSLNIRLTFLDSGIDTISNCYQCSRKRRSLIFNALRDHGIDKVAFGHHRDDSIQTLLMNMLHKAEFCANLPVVPMQKFGVTILRPLIFVPEEEILAFARRHGFLKIMCQCPYASRSKRREVKDLLNAMQEVYPNAKRNLSLLAEHLGEKKALKP